MAYNPYGEVRKTVPVPHRDSVVNLDRDDHPSLSRNLLRDLHAERAKHYEGLISAKDWPDFEKRRGVIHGIDTAIGLCEEQKAKLNA